MSLHFSHRTRFSDSSFYDEICTLCGHTDIAGAGWGKLAEPCPMNSILGFRGSTRWLSNFAECPVIFDGVTYPSVEHAYQAAKCDVVADRRLFKENITAFDAKRLGNKVPLRANWNEETRLKTMFDLLVQKFQSEPYKTNLLNTGERYIEETNTWGDTFWGVCDDRGTNHLGRMIMKIRTNLRTEMTNKDTPSDKVELVELKSWSHFFDAIKAGQKRHDLRSKKDRNFHVGQRLRLMRYDNILGGYTGESMVVEVTYITSNDTPCAFSSAVLDRDYCILSLMKVIE